MKMNLPNKLTIFRIIMVPVFLAFLVAIPFENENTSRIICAAIYIVTCGTDFFDGIIARKFNMITNFGKFMDPLADKFIVFAALLGILAEYDYIRSVFVWAAAIVMFRELAITSIRLVVSDKSHIVIAASWLGKFKTLSQMVCIVSIILEPVVFPCFKENHILSYVTIGIMIAMTLWSGIDYISKYWKYIVNEDEN